MEIEKGDSMQDAIDNLTGYELDSAIAEAAEPCPMKWAKVGTYSPGGWWIAGQDAWLPRPRMCNDAVRTAVALMDLLEEWQQHVNIEDQGRQRGDERFYVMCGGMDDMAVANAATFEMAISRAFLRVAAKRGNPAGIVLQSAGAAVG